MANEHADSKGSASEPEPADQSMTRREAIKGTAVKAAMIALFGGAMTLDSLTAKALGRVNEVRAVRELGAGAAAQVAACGGARISGVAPLNNCAPGTLNSCTDMPYQCGTQGCYAFGCTNRTFDCPNTFSCGTYGGTSMFTCAPNGFICDCVYKCKVGHVSCQDNPYSCPQTYTPVP